MTGKEAYNEYMRKYRAKNRERLNEQARQRYKKDPERHRQYTYDYWERKAKSGAEEGAL